MKKVCIKQFILSLSFIFILITIVSISISVKAAGGLDDPVEHIVKDDLYYTDRYFTHSSTEYDPHLASLSMVFANSTSPGGDPKNPHDQDWFKKQPNRLNEFLTKIHFTDFDCNDDYKKKTGFDTIGVGAAQKKINDEYTVVALGIRSGHYELEWSNNIWLGDGSKSDYMHEGWYNAANKALSFLDSYVKGHVTTSKIKLWLVGFSRGGATANLTAGLLDNQIKKNPKTFKDTNITLAHDDLFAYTFEAPQGANYNSKTVETPKSKIYNNIWNIINPNDIVPKVAMSQYGFTRFGTDKYITTRFYDPANFTENRAVYNKLLSKLTSSEKKPDEFEMYGLPIDFLAKGLASKICGGDFTVLQRDYTKSNYDANIAEMLLLEETTKQIGSREDYAKRIQPGLKDLLLVIMEYNYDFNAETGGDIKSRIPAALGGFIVGGIIYLGTGSTEYIKYAMLMFNSSIDSQTISKAVEAAIPLFGPIFSAYWNRPNELISIGKYVEQILYNHDTEVTLAHIQAQDSYYIDAYNNDPSNKTKIRLVPFLDNVDYGRMSFLGFNDLDLYRDDARRISIEGYVMGRSDIRDCQDGYAAGYYSYATEERMEIFFPANAKYKIKMKDYSKKPYHTFDYWAYYQYFGLGPNGETKRQLDSFHDWTCFNSKRYSREVTIK